MLKRLEEQFKLPDVCAQRKKEGTSARSLAPSEIMALFFVLTVGLTVAFCVFLLEVFGKKFIALPQKVRAVLTNLKK